MRKIPTGCAGATISQVAGTTCIKMKLLENLWQVQEKGWRSGNSGFWGWKDGLSPERGEARGLNAEVTALVVAMQR